MDNNINTTKKTEDDKDIKQGEYQPAKDVLTGDADFSRLEINWDLKNETVVYLNTICEKSPPAGSSKIPSYTEFDANSIKVDADHFINGFTSKLLGSGGHGRIYRSVCKNTGKPYVIKSICQVENYNLTSDDLNREFGNGCSLSHDNIIGFEYSWYGNCEHGECRKEDSCIIVNNNKPRQSFFILMEHSCLESLNKQMNNPDSNKLNKVEIKETMRQIIEPVKHMHSVGIIHGDISRDNILFDKTLTCSTILIWIKVIDFGLSYKLKDIKHVQIRNKRYSSKEQDKLMCHDIVTDYYSIIALYCEMILLSKNCNADSIENLENILSFSKIYQLIKVGINEHTIEKLANQLVNQYFYFL